MLEQGEVPGAHGSDGLQRLGDVMGVDVDAILQVELPVAGGELPLPPQVLVQGGRDGRDDTGPGDPLGLPVHGPVGLDGLQSEVDLVPLLGEDVVVQDLADPLEVVCEVGDRAGSGEHPAPDGLSLHGRSRRGGSGVDVVPDLQRHLGVGPVVGDHAVPLVLEETALVHHGQRIGPDLVPDGRGDEKLASVLDVESDVHGGEDSRIPLLGLDAPRLVGVLAGEGQVVDGNPLEQGQLDGVPADADPLDLLEVDSEGPDQLVLGVDQDLVGHVRSDVDAEREMVHDVGTRERVTLGHSGRQDPAVLQVDGVGPATAGPYVYRYSVTHRVFLLSLSKKEGFFSFFSGSCVFPPQQPSS